MTAAIDDLMIRETVRGILADPAAATLPGRLADSGFGDLLAETTAAAVRGLFHEQGRLLIASPALDLIVAHGLGVDIGPDQALVHPAVGSGGAPPATIEDDGSITVHGTLLSGSERATALVIPTAWAAGVTAVRVDTSTVTAEPATGLDAALGLRAVHAVVGRDALRSLPLTGDWTTALALGRLALACEQLGVVEALQELVVDHVSHRHQFGRPIGAHQAVKHRLADVLVAASAAGSVVADVPDAPDYWHGAAAKALAGRAAGLAVAAAMQVCGGLGFTDEFGLHHYVRRAQMLDALLGSCDQLTVELGRRLSRATDVPALVSL